MVIFSQYRMFSWLPAAYYAVSEVADAISVTGGYNAHTLKISGYDRSSNLNLDLSPRTIIPVS